MPRSLGVPLLILLLTLVSPARGAVPLPSAALSEYYKICEALAGDSTKGVLESAKAFAARVREPSLSKSAENVAAATQVDLKKTREVFRTFNHLLIEAIRHGDVVLDERSATFRVFCPMKKADWLQEKKEPIRNPYHGLEDKGEMLTCGVVMESFGPK